MESQPQNPEFRINPENFHPCSYTLSGEFLSATGTLCVIWKLLLGAIQVMNTTTLCINTTYL